MNNNAIQSRLMGQAISSRMFSGYAQANNIRLAQVVSKKLTAAQEASGLHPTLDSLHTPLRPKALSFEQSAFLKNYRNNMLDLQSTAAQATAARTRQTLAAGSSDPAVAEVAGRLEDLSDRYTVTVEQVASGQVDRSAAIQADAPMPTTSGSLYLETDKGRFDFYLSGAGMEDNREMLETFADRVNQRETGVTASVQTQEDGKIYLQLESETGGDSSFTVKGTLAGRLDIQKTEAPQREAVYTVQKNGGEVQRVTSDKNTVTIDKGITATLKKPGTTQVSSITDAAEGMADNLSRLVDKYNSTLNFLRQNSDRGWGVRDQLRRMTGISTPESSREKIGVTSGRDGTLSFDRDTFLTQARRAPRDTQRIVEDFTQSLREDAQQGMKESSGSLVGPLEYVQRAERTQLDPVNVLSTYSRNGVYNLMNLYAAGVLMNLNA